MIGAEARSGTIETEAEVARQQSHFSNVLAAVTLVYFLGVSFLPGYYSVEIGWLLLSLILLGAFHPKSWAVVVIFYLCLLFFFLLGAAFDNAAATNMSYLRTLASWTVFSALLFATLRYPSRRFTGIPRARIPLRLAQLLGILVILFWSIGSLREISEGSVVDFREITGQNYLVVADLFAMTAIAFLLRPGISAPVYLLVAGSTLVALFFLSSRTSLVFFPIALLFTVGRQVRLSVFLLVALPSLVASSVYFVNQIGTDTFNMARVTALFDLSSDESATARSQFRENTLTRLDQSPSCLIVPCHPTQGMYDHSILSVVEFFGLAGIWFLLIAIAACAYYWRRIYASWYLPLFVYCLLSLAFSRAWVSAAFPVGVALLFDVLARNTSWRGTANRRLVGNDSSPAQPKVE